jgi:hypothetical protein
MRRFWMVGLMGLGAATLGGCEKPLFPETMPRTQYERYDRLRGRYIPSQQMNVYGGSEPALRERLSPPTD